MHGVIKTPIQADNILQFWGVNGQSLHASLDLGTEKTPAPMQQGFSYVPWWLHCLQMSRYCVTFSSRHLQQSQHVEWLCGPAEWCLCSHEHVWLQQGAAKRMHGSFTPKYESSSETLQEWHLLSCLVFECSCQNMILLGAMKCLYAFFCVQWYHHHLMTKYLWNVNDDSLWLRDILSAVSVWEFSEVYHIRLDKALDNISFLIVINRYSGNERVPQWSRLNFFINYLLISFIFLAVCH